MGYGDYSHAAHVALTARRRHTAPDREVFSQRACHPQMDPHGVGLRESRDSEAHPASLAIIFALDVSGSMGEIPRRLARHTLPDFMQALLDAGVSDPQVMFMAVGCANGDRAPLQVGQFESTASLIDRWLTQMYLEGGGAGGSESYELAMYFAARHTVTDCVQRRGRRGYLFITGDEPPNPAVSRAQVQRLMGDPIPDDIPIRQIITETMRAWEPFFLIPEAAAARGVQRAWRDLLGDRVVVMESPDDTSTVAAGLVSLLEGEVDSLNALVKKLAASGMDRRQAGRVAKALLPFAASIGRDGAPNPATRRARLPRGDSPSGHER